MVSSSIKTLYILYRTKITFQQLFPPRKNSCTDLNEYRINSQALSLKEYSAKIPQFHIEMMFFVLFGSLSFFKHFSFVVGKCNLNSLLIKSVTLCRPLGIAWYVKPKTNVDTGQTNQANDFPPSLSRSVLTFFLFSVFFSSPCLFVIWNSLLWI